MIFGQNRAELRAMYRESWRKQLASEPLEPLESQIAAVISEHPEYHAVVSDNIERDFAVDDGETNPFLHMGLHLGLREQLATDRPAGIAKVFHRLAARLGNAHDAEHRMIDCLAEALWESQRRNAPPDEVQYLEKLRRL